MSNLSSGGSFDRAESLTEPVAPLVLPCYLTSFAANDPALSLTPGAAVPYSVLEAYRAGDGGRGGGNSSSDIS